MLRDLLIITCVLLIILTLISLIGGSIRFNDDATPKVIHPEKYANKQINHTDKPSVEQRSARASEILQKFIATNSQKPREGDKTKNTKGTETVEPFQGIEFAMF